MQNNYFSQAKKIKNPLKLYGIAKVLENSFKLLFSILLVYTVINHLFQYGAFRTYQSMGNAWFLLVVSAIVGIIIFCVSIIGLFKGVKHIKKLRLPASIPNDLKSYKNIEWSLRNQKIQDYSKRKHKLPKLVKKIIKENAEYLNEKAFTVSKSAITYARNFLIFLGIFILLFVAKAFMPLTNLEPDLQLFIDSIHFPILLFIVAGIVMAARIIALFYMVHPAAPKTEVSEEKANVVFDGKPIVIEKHFRKSLEKIGRDNIPNRINKKNLSRGKIRKKKKNKGEFHHQLFVENQPQLSDFRRPPAAHILNFTAVLTTIAAMVSISLPAFLYEYGYNITELVSMSLYFISGIILLYLSRSLFKHGDFLLNIFRFESIIMFIDIQGKMNYVNRAERNKNVSIANQFGAESVANVKIYTTKVLTEAYKINGKRSFISMIVDEQTNEAIETVKNIINEMEKQKINDKITEKEKNTEETQPPKEESKPKQKSPEETKTEKKSNVHEFKPSIKQKREEERESEKTQKSKKEEDEFQISLGDFSLKSSSGKTKDLGDFYKKKKKAKNKTESTQTQKSEKSEEKTSQKQTKKATKRESHTFDASSDLEGFQIGDDIFENEPKTSKKKDIQDNKSPEKPKTQKQEEQSKETVSEKKNIKQKDPIQEGSEEGTKVCPNCGKEVPKDAIICRHCQYEFVSDGDLWKILSEL